LPQFRPEKRVDAFPLPKKSYNIYAIYLPINDNAHAPKKELMPSPFPKKAITSTPFIYQLMTTLRLACVGIKSLRGLWAP
jgi:hypothetical protein